MHDSIGFESKENSKTTNYNDDEEEDLAKNHSYSSNEELSPDDKDYSLFQTKNSSISEDELDSSLSDTINNSSRSNKQTNLIYKNNQDENNNSSLEISEYSTTGEKSSQSELSNHLFNSLSLSSVQKESEEDSVSTSQDELANVSECIVLYTKSRNLDEKSALDYNELDKVSLLDLLRLQTPFKTSNIVANRYHSNFYPKNSTFLDDSHHIISSLLADKIYQLYREHNEKVEILFDRAIKLINLGVKVFEGHDAHVKDVWDGLLESIPTSVKCLISFAKEIPGINELNQTDFTNLVNNRIFDYFIIKHAPLFINGESYLMLPNQIQYTRSWMERIIGKEMVDSMFKFAEEFNLLKMTSKEIALMYPFVLTVPDENFKDVYTIASLNEYYYRALMYEFDLNRRTNVFVNRWKMLIARLPQLNELQAERIGGLTPECKITIYIF